MAATPALAPTVRPMTPSTSENFDYSETIRTPLLDYLISQVQYCQWNVVTVVSESTTKRRFAVRHICRGSLLGVRMNRC